MLPGHPTEVVGSVTLTTYTTPFSDKIKLHLVTNKAEWDAVFPLFMAQKYLCCDTETEGFQYYKKHRICGLSFGWGETNFYIPVRHKVSVLDPVAYEQLTMDEIRPDLQKLFGRLDLVTIWHNWKFDAHFLRADGIEVKCKYHDTRLLWQIYNENAPGYLKTIASGWKDPDLGIWQNGLVHRDASKWEAELGDWREEESKARRKLFSNLVMAKADVLQKDMEFQGWKRNDIKKHIKDVLMANHPYREASKEDVDYSYIPIPLMAKYAALDTYLTWVVYNYCMQGIEWNKQLTALYVNEVKLSRVLMEAETHGVRVDRAHLVRLSEKYTKKIKELSLQIFQTFGYESLKDVKPEDFNEEHHPFKLGSNEQLAKKLLEHGVKLTKRGDPTKKNAEGQLKVDAKALKKFEKKHAIVKIILELRKYSKLLGTYVNGIIEKLTDDDVLHCSFNQNVKTGRMSSQDPNLQNIPGRGEGEEIRRAFINWSDEYVYVLADYSQVEVRLTAHYSQDPLLLNSYLNGEDVHLRTACEMFNIPIDEGIAIYADEKHARYKEVKALRDIAKRINFGIIYGVGAPGLSEQINRPDKHKDLDDEDWVQVCQEFIDRYLEKYKGVKRFISRNVREIKRTCLMTNYFGRIRRLPHAQATQILGSREFFWMEARAGRQGVNFLIQGCQDPNAPILTTKGYIPLNKLEAAGKPPLVTYTGVESQYTVLNTGVKDCVEVETSISTGVCSTKHKFFVLNPDTMDLEFKSIKDLPVGSLVVAVTERVPEGFDALTTEDTAELLGILIGDGSYGVVRGMNGSRTKECIRNTVSVACGLDKAWADYVASLIRRVFPYVNPSVREVVKSIGNTNYIVAFENKQAREALVALGLERVVREAKTVPAWLLTQPENIKVAVLRGLMDTDGGLNGHTIGFTNKSKQVAESVQLLLQSLGIQARLKRDGAYYRVLVLQEYLTKYAAMVDHRLEYKSAHALEYGRTTKYTKAAVPQHLLEAVRTTVLGNSNLWKSMSRSQRTSVKSLRMNKYTALDLLSHVEQTSEVLNLQDLLNLTWASIQKVTPVGSQPTMDLELHGVDHSYICRGLVQHNTAADVFKFAVVRLFAALKGMKSVIVNFVHDEVQMYIHKSELHILKKLKELMEAFDFSVPLLCDFSWTEKSWADKTALH